MNQEVAKIEVPEQVIENCMNEVIRCDDVLKIACDLAFEDRTDDIIVLAEMTRISLSRIEMTLAKLIGVKTAVPSDLDLEYIWDVNRKGESA